MPNGPNKLADPLVIPTHTSAPRSSQSTAAATLVVVTLAPGPAHRSPGGADATRLAWAALMNLAAFPSSSTTLATPATLPWHEMPLNSFATISSSLLRRSLCASLRRISHMASAAAPTSAPAAAANENGAAKTTEQRPVQVRAPALFLH